MMVGIAAAEPFPSCGHQRAQAGGPAAERRRLCRADDLTQRGVGLPKDGFGCAKCPQQFARGAVADSVGQTQAQPRLEFGAFHVWV